MHIEKESDSMAKITLNSKKCTGCGQCVNVCAVGIYSIIQGKAKFDEKKSNACFECHACEVSCPSKAIKMG